MAEQRIYSITNINTGDVVALVQAGTPAQAIRHHARSLWGVAVAIPEQLIAATKIGIEVEKAVE